MIFSFRFNQFALYWLSLQLWSCRATPSSEIEEQVNGTRKKVGSPNRRTAVGYSPPDWVACRLARECWRWCRRRSARSLPSSRTPFSTSSSSSSPPVAFARPWRAHYLPFLFPRSNGSDNQRGNRSIRERTRNTSRILPSICESRTRDFRFGLWYRSISRWMHGSKFILKLLFPLKRYSFFFNSKYSLILIPKRLNLIKTIIYNIFILLIYSKLFKRIKIIFN